MVARQSCFSNKVRYFDIVFTQETVVILQIESNSSLSHQLSSIVNPEKRFGQETMTILEIKNNLSLVHHHLFNVVKPGSGCIICDGSLHLPNRSQS